MNSTLAKSNGCECIAIMASLKLNSIARILSLTISFLLISCASLDVNYLDDNYSDRWQLAKEILGQDAIYYDISMYAAAAADPEKTPANNIRHASGGKEALVALLSKTSKTQLINVAVSGVPTDYAANILLEALNQLPNKEHSGIKLLYIGTENISNKIERIAKKKGMIYLFAKLPETAKE